MKGNKQVQIWNSSSEKIINRIGYYQKIEIFKKKKKNDLNLPLKRLIFEKSKIQTFPTYSNFILFSEKISIIWKKKKDLSERSFSKNFYKMYTIGLLRSKKVVKTKNFWSISVSSQKIKKLKNILFLSCFNLLLEILFDLCGFSFFFKIFFFNLKSLNKGTFPITGCEFRRFLTRLEIFWFFFWKKKFSKQKRIRLF
mmetsp:Transcript_30523/g.61524  ORF Transcript_30523/g.61524 Transcript_30523/m.61524 type:complete len:197 (-) Transcript_30523:2705-3295(-)